MRRPTSPCPRVGLTVLALALVCAMAFGGCGASDPSTTPNGTVAGTIAVAALVPPATSPADPAGTHRFNTYWMRDCPAPEVANDITGCRLAVGESRTTTEPDIERAAIDALMAGPDQAEIDNQLGTNIRTTTEVNRLTVEGDLATIDFNRYFETAKTRPQAAQVVYTLTQLPGIARVQILVDGMTNGAIGALPLTRDDIGEFDPAVLIESPALGATVGRRFKVVGSSSARAGAPLGFRLEAPDGTVIVEGSATVLPSPGNGGVVLVPVEVPAPVSGLATLVIFEAVSGSGGPTGPFAQRVPVVVAAP